MIEVFVKRKILTIKTVLSTHAHTHARTHTHTHTQSTAHTHTTHTHRGTRKHSDYTKQQQNHSLKQAANKNLRWMKTAEQKRKHGNQVYILWNVFRLQFRLQFNESREGFCQRGRGRSFHVDGPKTETAREPTVESLVWKIWMLMLRMSEAEWRVQEGV